MVSSNSTMGHAIRPVQGWMSRRQPTMGATWWPSPALLSPAAFAVASAAGDGRAGSPVVCHPWSVSLNGSGNLGVGSWIERRARVAPDHLALIAKGQPVSYAELAARIRRLANGLRSLGVARGDRVAWLGPNDPAFLESLFAAGLLGAVLAPVNHRLEPAQRAFVLSDTRPTILLEHLGLEPTPVPSSVRHRVAVGGSRSGTVAYEALIAGSPDERIDEAVGLDDLFLLPHTSGTTGNPKAVMLSHGNATWNVVNFLSCADFRGDDVTIAIAPFFRVGGTGVNVLPVLFAGGTVVVPDDLSPAGIIDSIERHRVTVGFGNPDLLDALVRTDRWPAADLSSIRFVITGGAPVPERLIRAFLDRGIMLLQGYGLSEAGPLALLLDAPHALEKIGSAGRPPLLVDVRIVGADMGDAPAGQTGELLVRGPNVMLGYWNRPAETAEVLIDGGWLRTGDAARVDDDGFVWIVDRVEARFPSAGGVVYPGDVERVLTAHPSVADAGVVGAPGPDNHEVGAAFVVLAPGRVATESELIAFSAGRLAAHEVPASITFVETLPRSSVGKLVRDELRARLPGRGPD
jgi:acyl-CoA synthetase (AMP-forming)/AMP-acid ligase II